MLPIRTSHRRRHPLAGIALVAALAAAALIFVPATPAAASEPPPAGTAKGAFTCDFRVAGSVPPDQLVFEMDRDRQALAGSPGLRHKLIPARIDGADYLAGGRYLFDTYEQARDYLEVLTDFSVDGVTFFDRWYFSDLECYPWQTIGARAFADIRTHQVVLRTERWHVPDGCCPRLILHVLWPILRAQAAQRGLTAAWLLYQPEHRLASLVYFDDRAAPWEPGPEPDFASLAAIESAPPLGGLITALGWEKTFDRSQWALNIWVPFDDPPSLWPNSPPFPGPQA